jgi:orotidine-5'-phosphate decarboxylase
MNKPQLNGNPFFYLAMDFMDQDVMLRNAELVAPVQGNWGFKVNDDYVSKYTAPVAMSHLGPFGKSIFVDLKLFKGKRRMINQIKELGKTGVVDFTNIYALVGDELLTDTFEATKDTGVDIMVLTVLTHMTEEYCRKYFQRSLGESVRMFTETAVDAHCPAVLAPATGLDSIRDIQILKASPGIRPSWYKSKKANQQEQEATPTEAVDSGADILIAYSPVWDTDAPVDSLMRILDEMNEAYFQD